MSYIHLLLLYKHNKVLYAVPYQHFTNAIENFFSVFKSRLQKKVGITYSELKENIKETLNAIPSEIFNRIFQGSYERDEKYKRKSRKRSRRKSKQYKRIDFYRVIKIGVLNLQRCKKYKK